MFHKIPPPSGGPAEVGCGTSRPQDPKVLSPLPPSPRPRLDRRAPGGGGGPAESREIAPRGRADPSARGIRPPVRPGVRSGGTTAKDPASFEVTSDARPFGTSVLPGRRGGR